MEQKIQLVHSNNTKEKKDSKPYIPYKSYKTWQSKPRTRNYYHTSGYSGYYQQYNMYPYYQPVFMPPPINVTFQQAEEHQFYNDFPRADDYDNFSSIVAAFPHLAKINEANFDVDGIKDCRTFIMRSNNEDDVHKAIKYRVWTSTQTMNEKLKQAFDQCKEKKIPIFLFYSVMKSGQFIGVAELKSSLINEDFEYWWEPGRWRQKFEIDWLFIKDIPFSAFENLRSQDGYNITRAKDGTSIQLSETKQMLRIFKEKQNYKSIFSAFHYMDVREDYMRIYRNPTEYYQDISQYTYGYTSNLTSKKTEGNAFKYNTFPGQNDQKKESNEHKCLENFKNILKEFETMLNFYETHYQEWVQKIKGFNENNASSSSQENSSSSDKNKESNGDIGLKDLQNNELGLSEGIEQLESKYANLEKLLQELTTINQNNVGRIGDTNNNKEYEKHKGQYNKLVEKLTHFKKNFENDKNNFMNLCKKI